MTGEIRKAYVDDQLAFAVWVRRQDLTGVDSPFSDRWRALQNEWDSMTTDERSALVSEEEIRAEGEKRI